MNLCLPVAGARIRHGVTMVSVGGDFIYKRSILGTIVKCKSVRGLSISRNIILAFYYISDSNRSQIFSQDEKNKKFLNI